MFTVPKTYTEGMEEIVKWSNSLPEDYSTRFMLDLYKIYIDWKYLLETTVEENNNA
jgi:hypothetical protein